MTGAELGRKVEEHRATKLQRRARHWFQAMRNCIILPEKADKYLKQKKSKEFFHALRLHHAHRELTHLADNQFRKKAAATFFRALEFQVFGTSHEILRTYWKRWVFYRKWSQGKKEREHKWQESGKFFLLFLSKFIDDLEKNNKNVQEELKNIKRQANSKNPFNKAADVRAAEEKLHCMRT